MAGQSKRGLLAIDIAKALSRSYQQKQSGKALFITGIALACLQTHPAQALTLGDLKVTSGLGQPLVSTTTARIKPGESLSNECITSAATPDGGMALPENLQISVSETSTPGEYPVRITSRTPLYEPMYEIRLQVKCSGNVTFMRDYVVMLNLPMTSPRMQPALKANNPAISAETNQAKNSTIAKPEQSPSLKSQNNPNTAPNTSAGVASTEAPEPAPTEPQETVTPYTQRFPTPTSSIDTGSEYQVQSGDMLSTIAQRIEGRPKGTTYDVADIVFRMNPDAFVANDPNRIRLGATLRIPDTNELFADRRQLAENNGSRPIDTNELVVQTDPLNANDAVVTEEITVEKTALSNDANLDNINTTIETPAVIDSQQTASNSASTTPVAVAVSQSESVATTPEPQIVVDIREPLEPITEIERSEVVAASERALTPYKPAADSANAPSAAESNGGNQLHPLLIAGVGALLAFLAAGLIFGRRAFSLLIPVGKLRSTEDALQELDLSSFDDQNDPHQIGNPMLGDTDISDEELTRDSQDGFEEPAIDEPEINAPPPVLTNDLSDTDVEIDTSDLPSENALDFDLSDAEPEPVVTEQLDTGLEAELENTFIDELPLESTEKFATPDFSLDGAEVDQEPSELDGTSTMRKLFSEEADANSTDSRMIEDQYEVTREMPDLDDDFSLDATSDLQSLAEKIDEEDPDIDLSATLSEALGLLEQDYEEEFSASQILEQKDIEHALADHEKKDEYS